VERMGSAGDGGFVRSEPSGSASAPRRARCELLVAALTRLPSPHGAQRRLGGSIPAGSVSALPAVVAAVPRRDTVLNAFNSQKNHSSWLLVRPWTFDDRAQVSVGLELDPF